jgi:hypothetical protein
VSYFLWNALKNGPKEFDSVRFQPDKMESLDQLISKWLIDDRPQWITISKVDSKKRIDVRGVHNDGVEKLK